MITLGEIAITHRNGLFRMEVPVTMDGQTRPCWYELPGDFRDMVAGDRCDAFVAALLLPALCRGEDIVCRAPVSARFLHNLNHELIPSLNAFFPRFRPVSVRAGRTTEQSFGGNGVGTGFSGGIDAFVTVLDYLVQPVFRSLRLTHLFCFNVGSNGMGKTDAELERIRGKFTARCRALKPFADEMGVPFVPVDSNVHSFHSLGHLEGCSLVTPGAALLFQKALGKYLLSSGGYDHADKLEYLRRHPASLDVSCIDPWINHLYSTENTSFLSVGTDERRFDKTKRLARSGFDAPLRHLLVCGARGSVDSNCSLCEKCCMTILMLDILGEKALLEKRFDMEKYRKLAEKRYVARVLCLADREPYYQDMIRQAERAGYDLEARTTRRDKFMVRFIGSPLHEALRNMPVVHALGKAVKGMIE